MGMGQPHGLSTCLAYNVLASKQKNCEVKGPDSPSLCVTVGRPLSFSGPYFPLLSIEGLN